MSGSEPPAAASPHPPAKPTLVFVESLDDPHLQADDHHHLARVLRVRDGELITIADGAGRWRPAAFSDRPEPTGDVVDIARTRPAITIAFALVKGTKPELIVQKLTELGVDRIIVFEAERSVAHWDEAKSARNLERLHKVARESCMQARRPNLPTIQGPRTFAAVAALDGVVLADREGVAPSLDRPTVLIGPEGGWSEAERAHLAGAPSMGLGSHVLRAETAAIAAASAVDAAQRSRRDALSQQDLSQQDAARASA